jgi:hypothetical protein
MGLILVQTIVIYAQETSNFGPLKLSIVVNESTEFLVSLLSCLTGLPNGREYASKALVACR